VFGAAACGAVAGFNLARLGKRQYLIPSVIAGAALFIALAGLAVFVLPDHLSAAACLLANFAVGLGFLLVQKPYFDGWKAANWRPRSGERYRPNGLVQLLLVGCVSLGLEVGVSALIAVLGGIW